MRLAPDGRRYATLLFVVGVLTAPVVPLLSVGFLAAGGFTVWFYRDPARHPPASGIVAPADGRVSVVRVEESRVRVGVFMGPLDVHVVRAPMDGIVDTVTHRPGAHRPAFSKESERNERLDIAFEDARARTGTEPATDPAAGFEVSLIAGAFARRITHYRDAGEFAPRGSRLGHIAFGSRTDVLLPPEYDPDDVLVSTGDTVSAGETAIAE